MACLECFGTVVSGRFRVNVEWPVEARANGRYFPESSVCEWERAVEG